MKGLLLENSFFTRVGSLVQRLRIRNNFETVNVLMLYKPLVGNKTKISLETMILNARFPALFQRNLYCSLK